MKFSGKVVIVTGSGKGIGKAIAEAYALKGANVVIAEKDIPAGKEAADRIKGLGGEVFFQPTDVSLPTDILRLIDETKKVYGRIDILVNNAGISRWKSPYELEIEEWDEILNVNLRAIFLCARETAKLMKIQGGGSIVNISSTRAIMSEPNSEAYAASKGGIIALTHALALSLAPDNIRVNAISPGWIETGDYSELRALDHRQHPAGRVGKPEDVARACLFLTSEGNDFITASNLVIDGGMTRKMIYEP